MYNQNRLRLNNLNRNLSNKQNKHFNTERSVINDINKFHNLSVDSYDSLCSKN